jgi:hypothetical protein
MKRLTIALIAMMLSSGAFAGASSFVDAGLVIGGEGSGSQDGGGAGNNNGGIEVTGAWAINDLWYIGGVGGNYTREGGNGDTDNTYFAFNGGAVIGLTEKTDIFGEAAIWAGNQDNPGSTADSDPKAIEAKAGITTLVGDKLTLGASISLIAGNLDTGDSEALRNFVWSAGGAWNFTPHMAATFKLADGSNGVNGQTDIFRIGFRYTF